MARKILAGNWKMNMLRPEAESFFQSFEKSMERIPSDVEVYLFPSYPHLASFPAGSRCVLGAQNCSDHKPGAHTGEVSIEMLASYGVKAVIIGHSERRLPCQEGSIVLDRKVQRAREAKMTIFYCVGEPEAVRNLGMDSVWQFVSVQLETVKFVDPEKLVIAYEPIWAIGTRKSATPEDAEWMCSRIAEAMRKRFVVDVPVIYGGSCNAENAKDLFAQPHVSGGLIGGASLDVESFTTIGCSFPSGK